MTIHFGQVYVQPGVSFPFTHHFQRRLSEAISALVEPSPTFAKKFGDDYALIFRISAKKGLHDNEVLGPTVFKKARDVEYTVFLPFDEIARSSDVPRTALRYLLKGVCSVFNSLGIDSSRVVGAQESIVEGICSDPKMID